MKLNNLHELFVHELKDLYDAEHQLVDALPQMVDGASSSELKGAFKEHLTQTKNHIKRLEQVFSSIDERPAREACKGMKGLVQEGSKMLEADADNVVKDAALISAAQRVEHYEMAGYGTLRTYAYMMGHQEAARLLQETLDEEEQTDKKLTQIANSINTEAMR